MAKTSIYIAVLAILGLGIYFFIFRDNDNPFSASEAGFNFKDTAAIGRIFIASNDGDMITVDRTNDGWMLNKKYKAMPSMMNLMLTTLAQQKALYPVTKNAYENVVKSLATFGTKVEVYDRQGKKLSVFYVGHVAINNSGTNMMIEGAKTPYVVQVPAFTGDLSTRYSTNIRDWRDRTVFNIAPDNIKRVSVQYADRPINSFVVSRTPAGYTVTGDPSVTTALDTLHTTRANMYMGYFQNINCEGYMNGLQGLDTAIMTTVKMSSIDIETINGGPQHLDIYWMPINRRSKNLQTSDSDVPDDYDSDRMFAIMNGGKDTVMIQTRTFKKILRRSYEFFQKDQPHPEQQHAPKNVVFKKDQ